jgi:hypothetical protein
VTIWSHDYCTWSLSTIDNREASALVSAWKSTP